MKSHPVDMLLSMFVVVVVVVVIIIITLFIYIYINHRTTHLYI